MGIVGVIVVLAVLIGVVWLFARTKPVAGDVVADLSMLPQRFVVYDLETTGLDPDRHEIIEIGAIRVNRDDDLHETFQTLVVPKGRIGPKIIKLTGITREMVQADGMSLVNALTEFRNFVGDLPLVAFNAEFDDAFLLAACSAVSMEPFGNETCCALKMARRAWPNRASYRLVDLARDGNLSAEGTHRALGDCQRTMIVYAAAARRLGSYR